ncbi:MAG: hypothetical protein J6G98_00235 [Bacilli bacterium]|nr:hypothetical protein [Bacilli bacterium]
MKNVFKRFTSMIISTVLIFNIFAPLTVNALPATTDIYVVWDCDDEVCVSDAITVNNGVEGAGGVINYETNYIKASEVVDHDRNKTLKPSSVTNANNGLTGITKWYIYENLPADIKTKTWEELDIAIHEEDYDKGIDPTGGNDGFNSLVHNGDRKYRVVIYDDTLYESLTFNVDPNNYTYYLGSWDPVFANPTIDISGSTKDKPARYTTYLLEDTLKFSAGTINKETIASVKVLDVPEKGVSLTKSGDEYTVKFKSNYYSKVILEITGSNGGKYYLQIDRTFIKSGFRGGPTPSIISEFIYPADTSYTDYDVIATITKKDGSIETKKLTAFEITDWDDIAQEPVTKYVWDAGENLKKTGYKIDATEDIKNVDITVTLKNATSTDTYGGTFGGYGKGVSIENVSDFIDNVFRN